MAEVVENQATWLKNIGDAWKTGGVTGNGQCHLFEGWMGLDRYQMPVTKEGRYESTYFTLNRLRLSDF